MNYLGEWTYPRSSFRSAETARKIRHFRLVQSGWHYGEGVPPSPHVINVALEILAHVAMTGFADTDAFLGVNGEVRVTIYSRSTYLEFTVEPNETISYVREDHDREIDYRPVISINDVFSILSETGRELWASFGFSTTGTTITVADVFNPLHSGTRRTAPEYL
jgi:hypothetical protein